MQHKNFTFVQGPAHQTLCLAPVWAPECRFLSSRFKYFNFSSANLALLSDDLGTYVPVLPEREEEDEEKNNLRILKTCSHFSLYDMLETRRSLVLRLFFVSFYGASHIVVVLSCHVSCEKHLKERNHFRLCTSDCAHVAWASNGIASAQPAWRSPFTIPLSTN